jgi:hypothetical protein
MEKPEGELIIMVFNYYYGSEADQFNFIRIPKRLITDPLFADLSLSAKLLYGILLDRMSLSMKNKWLDKENRVYIIYQISEIMENLNMAEKTAIKTLKELEVVGLIEKKRRGLGLPSLLYVKNFIIDDKQQEMKEKVEDKGIQIEESSRTGKLYSSRPVENEGSRTVNMEVQEQQKKMALISKTDFSDIDYSKTNTNHIKSNQIILEDEMGNDEINTVSAYQELIKENIDYDLLIERHPYDREIIEGIYNLLIEVVLNQSEMMIVSSSELPTALVKSRFLKLNLSHIEYVMNSLQSNTTKVNNIKKYLLASLFNAPSTISGYYQAEVNHDMPQFARK